MSEELKKVNYLKLFTLIFPYVSRIEDVWEIVNELEDLIGFEAIDDDSYNKYKKVSKMSEEEILIQKYLKKINDCKKCYWNHEGLSICKEGLDQSEFCFYGKSCEKYEG